ncbi:MAG: type I DNA topoisomerase [Candidatus Nanopelagicales bacterium]|nr:type I DNA topoisomerase [Candidatus Nanopelagicales bacterium]MDZ4248721.1 type I DNA topoisomerase [Candidatus Nanopelagicales bacterium]
MATRRLVIVESPAKAKTIQGYLGDGYTVESSVGHIRDLPDRAADVPEKYRGQAWAKTGVDIDNGFAPLYVVPSEKKSKVRDLKKALAESDELLLATDEDREGEAIAWHLIQVLNPDVPCRRMVFHEITPEAIAAAAQNTRDLNTDLVDAQETRRIVDRLFGYEVSPVLWRRVKQGLSAGRVQSVALRLVVERERERIAFCSAEYCDVRGSFLPGPFAARLVRVDAKRVATGRDFSDTGQLTNPELLVLNAAASSALAESLSDSQFSVASVQQQPRTRRPAAPFITSTLQQEASRRLRWTAQRTMRVAQGLYDRGFITYMRTDSTTLSEQAISAARGQARQLFGDDHVPAAPRKYDKKVKNAQEAHEAIRPAGEVFQLPTEASGALTGDDMALYELIWRRTLASQMKDATVATTTARLSATASDGRQVEFSASGTVVVFAGFLAAYQDTSDNENAKRDAGPLPHMTEGQEISATELVSETHRTNPPGRYTEASLVRALEERGIGRPSTFASIIATIIDRDYVRRRQSALVPSFLGMVVVRLLENHFADLVDYSFTARMEETLDAVAGGDTSRLDALRRFYLGDATVGFDGLRPLVDRVGEIDARALATFQIEGSDADLRVGRYGPFLERGEERVNVPEDLAPDELTSEKIEELFAQPRGERELGVDPASGNVVVVRTGRFGPYVCEVLPEGSPATERPRTSSLFKDMDMTSVDLNDALRLLSLPRVIGNDPADDQPIVALNGRYGPFIKKGTQSRSLETEEQLFTIAVPQALALLAQPPRRRGQRAAAPGRELGLDPTSGKPVTLKDGRFGPYVTDGEYNATVPKGEDPASVTLSQAASLLAERRAKGPAKKPSSRAKKAPAKKTGKRKAPAKKAPLPKT